MTPETQRRPQTRAGPQTTGTEQCAWVWSPSACMLTNYLVSGAVPTVTRVACRPPARSRHSITTVPATWCASPRRRGGDAGRRGAAARVAARWQPLNCTHGQALFLLLGDERREDHHAAAIRAQLPRARHARAHPHPAPGRPRRQRHGGLADRPEGGRASRSTATTTSSGIVRDDIAAHGRLDCVLVDEAQFLQPGRRCGS